MNFHLKCIFLCMGTVAVNSSYAQGINCGRHSTLVGALKGERIQLRTQVFDDGSIAVRAPLAVNPDGGQRSYTVGDHGFTYIANGIADFRSGNRSKCKSDCMKSFKEAEQLGFVDGTAEFCSFAIAVKAIGPGKKCDGGYVIGNGKGTLVEGAMLPTVTGGTVRTYKSMTRIRHLVNGNPEYLDAEKVPVAVTQDASLLGKVLWVGGARMPHSALAVIGDTGPAFGEGSIALHQLLRYGRTVTQDLGPIPVGQRCSIQETGLQAPFESRSDGGKQDRCRSGYTVTTPTDIRAYSGIGAQLDFVIFGKPIFPTRSDLIQGEVSKETLSAGVERAGYTESQVQRMLACLPH